jgi:hypothetical protein
MRKVIEEKKKNQALLNDHNILGIPDSAKKGDV